jgi:hypothetical protein
MRLSIVSPAIALFLISVTALGQQPANATARHAHRKHAVRHSSARKAYEGRSTQNVEVTNGTVTRTQVLNVPQSPRTSRRGAQTPPGESTVEVINGMDSQTVVFNAETIPGAHPIATRKGRGRRGSASTAAAPSVSSVQVINGTTSKTEYFYGDEKGAGAPQSKTGNKQPVVVGIETGSGTASTGKPPVVIGIVNGSEGAGGSKPPVVIGVASSGTAKNRGLTQRAVLSPHLKRPIYNSPPPAEK